MTGRWAALVAALLGSLPALAIVHGKAVNQPRFVQEFPWAVAVSNPVSGGVCTGVLISPDYVLTAAHCTAKNKLVLVGNTSRRRAKSVSVVEAIRHPGFDRDTKQFDIGLLRLEKPVDLSPITLIPNGEYLLSVKEHAAAMIMGWGRRPDSGYSDRLVLASIRLHELAMHGTQLIYRDRGGPCGGDSGGPLVIKGLEGRLLLVGVGSVTDGNLCATGGGFAAYSNIDVLRDFIEANVPDLPR